MTPGAPYYVMRWEQGASRYPGCQFVAGEGGNYGAGLGPYSPVDTPNCMRQTVRMLRASPYYDQFLAMHWWGQVDENAHPDWKGVDITPCFPWFFDWSCAGQPA